jgi:hypothetical protein
MNLVAAFRSEFSKSERYLLLSLLLKLILFATSILALIYEAGISAKGLLWLTAVVQLLLFLARWRSMAHEDFGEELRRRAMLQNGLGIEPSRIYSAKVLARVGNVSKYESMPTEYYSSKRPIGSPRLVEITAESAFYSHAIAWISGWMLIVIASVAVAIVIYSFFALVLTSTHQNTLELASKIAILAVTFWATDDWIMMAIRFFVAAGHCNEVLDRCSDLLESGRPISDSDAYVLLAEYHAGVSEAVQLPSFIYKLFREKLDRAWATFASWPT